MKNISKLTRIIFTVSLSVLAGWSVSASAQQAADFTIGKKGEVHFNVPVKVGSTVLKPGMYKVQHLLQGTGDVVSAKEHVLIFNRMEMPAGYRHSNTPTAKEEAARVKCTVEPVAKKVRNTTIVLRTNAAGEKELAEAQVAGEAFKHLL